MSENIQGSKLYQNIAQLRVNAVDAAESVHVMGRGTGKTVGILAPKAHKAMTLMPRSAGVNVAESYMQLLDRTLPPMIMRWQEMGMKRDVDFWVRKFPPKNIGLVMPYMAPETAEHSVFMRVDRYNISVMRMVSQDRPGSSNGMSVDWIMGDEVKFLNKEKLDSELMPTNRGNERYFKECHLHHGVTFTTDMPTTSGAKWIHEYEEHVDKDAIQLILAIQQQINIIKVNGRHRGRLTKTEVSEINFYEKELSKIRKQTIFYSEASTLDNIDVLGLDYVKRLKRTLPEFIFRTSVLNERPGKVEHTFYPDLADRHFYNAIDYSFADGMEEDKYGKGKMNDCRKDLDLDRSNPLEVGIDVGGRINVLVVGQEVNRTLKIINAIDVVIPGKNRMRHLAIEFDNYYKYYYKKEIIVYHDHTHNPSNPVSDKNPLDEFTDILRSKGWEVTESFIGATPSYRNRFFVWGALLNGNALSESEFYNVKFNKDNTTILRTAMECTKFALGGKTGYEKDKRMEKDSTANQQEAPHYSDAADTLVFGMIKWRRHGTKYESSLIEF